MGKTLTEQTRLWGASDAPPRQFGDGSPAHSHVPFDLPRMLNNLQTYCEPSYGFVHDVSAFASDAVTSSRILHAVVLGTGDSQVMLGQVPILVPIHATRLCWSFGISRSRAGEVTVLVNAGNVTAYLSSSPVINLQEPTAPNAEWSRNFLPSYISGPYSSNVVASGATADTPNPNYTLVESTSWTDFAPRGLNNINDRNSAPWAYLIMTINITGGSTGEFIKGHELSWWGEYG